MQPADNSARASHARFEATHWSEVLAAAQSGATHGPDALARLCERYWRPLYAFARRRGSPPDDAQDLVQGFFEHLIESRALGTIDQAKGRFRSFLLASFQNFSLTEQRRAHAEKRGGRAQMVWIDWRDAESRVGLEPAEGLTPETVFDARWAFELLSRATRRLEQEQTAQIFYVLRPFLGDECARVELSYEQAARALNVGLPALKTLIHRLRRRHAQLLREEVAQTVLDPNDVESELHALCEALVAAGGRVQA
jgi:RNA polymerase sigma factor (sigma-70 family)